MNLEISNIQVSYGKLNFSYTAKITDSIVGVYGPSGAGKSTLINILGGIESPKQGKIAFNSTELFNFENKINIPSHKRNIGLVFQDNYLFPHLNIKDNLLFSAPYTRNKQKIVELDAVIELLQINHLLLKKPAQLSGGEKQRVSIGRALLSQPELMLFDEPFSNLDRQHRKEIISYLLKINHRYNIPLLIVSHDLEDILRLTKTLLVISDGSITASGTYIDIAESGKAKNIISHKRFLNVFDAEFLGYDTKHKLHKFGKNSDSTELLYTNSELFDTNLIINQSVRLCISPDDIALSTNYISGTSFQNQIKGKIVKLIEIGKSVFVTIDCGFLLVAEISVPAYEKLKLEFGKELYCLIKAKAIEVIHVFKDAGSN